MNNQSEIIKPGAVSSGAVSNDAGTATSVASPAIADKSKSVKLELSEEEADMIQTLLNDYVLAYRSDISVDYKPEPVPREKVGQYPYVATPPAPEIINPSYDWINKKWYSKSGSTSLPEIAQAVKTLQSDQQAVKELSEGQANQNKLLASMQNLMLTIAGLQKTAEPTAPTQPVTGK